MSNYYLTNRSKYFLIIFSGLVLAIIWIIFFYAWRNILCLQISLIGASLFNIYYVIQKAQKEHITIHERGIEYNSPGISFETNWESIEEISTYWHNGFRNECLLVDNSQIRMKKWSLLLGRTIPTPFEFIPKKTIVPLSCFLENWRESELGQQVMQHAPHLFQ